MADEVTPPVSSRLQKIYLQVLFFLRFIQLGSTVMTGFIFCFLVWFHNNHYCAWYPSDCGPWQRDYVKVPWAEILMIFTCSAAFLESYVSSAFSLHRGQGQPNHTHLLFSTAPIVVLYAIAYRYYYKIPNVAGICYYDSNQYILGNVELRHCAIVTDAKFSGGVALLATALIFILSTAMLMLEKCREWRNLLRQAPAATEENNMTEKGGPSTMECSV